MVIITSKLETDFFKPVEYCLQAFVRAWKQIEGTRSTWKRCLTELMRFE